MISFACTSPREYAGNKKKTLAKEYNDSHDEPKNVIFAILLGFRVFLVSFGLILGDFLCNINGKTKKKDISWYS